MGYRFFILMELLIVIAILSILLSVGYAAHKKVKKSYMIINTTVLLLSNLLLLKIMLNLVRLKITQQKLKKLIMKQMKK